MAEFFGGDCELYYEVGGLGASSMLEVTQARDVKVGMTATEFDAGTRATYPWDATLPVSLGLTMEFDILRTDGDAAYTAIKDAWIGRLVIGLKALDANGGEGIQGNMCIVDFSRVEELKGGVVFNVSAKVMKSATNPTWVS